MSRSYSNVAYPHDRFTHQAEASTMDSYTNRHAAPRPDFARSQTMPRGPISVPPRGPVYLDHDPSDRAYPPHYAPQPAYTRHHRSYYDDRGPLPPPPLHHRQSHHEEPYHGGYDTRSPPLPSPAHPAQPHASYSYGYPTYAQHLAPAPLHHPHNPHHASFSSAGSSASSSLHSTRGSMPNPMAMPTGSQQQPTYRGHIKTTKDAILLLAACDLVEDAGAPCLPPPRRVTRRLLDSERADLICSGSIFVWDEKEAGMRRWTDGKCWSASRVSGCFLTYRELEARKKPSSSITGGPTSNLYKAEGLIKQSFSMTTTSGRKLHVISYYTKRDVREGLLRRVSEDPRFVGENGGEWGLEVDEAEYPDPISRAGDLPPGVNPDDLEGSQSPPRTAHMELNDVRPSRGEVAVAAHPREVVYHDRKMVCSPRSYLDVRDATDRSRIAADSREPHHVASHELMPRRGLEGHLPPYGHAKAEPTERLAYTAEVTPLHEARGLLPIRPIPVDSKFVDLPLRRISKEAALEVASQPGHLYGRKRLYQDLGGVPSLDDSNNEAGAPKSTRPRLQRLRSSSMSNPHSSSSAQGVLAPIRPLGRVGSDDEGVSKLRSTHGHGGQHGFKEQHDSAVGALLSLRSGSGSSDDCSHSKTGPLSQSPPTSAQSNAETDDLSSKPAFSRMDRAALDRFSVRI